MGLPMHTIRRLPAHRRDSMNVRFVTNLSGQQVGSLPYERMALDVLEASPEVSSTLLFTFPPTTSATRRRRPIGVLHTAILLPPRCRVAAGGALHLTGHRETMLICLLTTSQMVHNVAQPDLECIIETMMERQFNVDYRKGWTWLSHEEVS